MVPYLRETKKLKNLIEFIDFRNFKNFDFCALKLGEEYNFTINFKELHFDFKIIVGESDTLTSFFNSAIPDSKSKNITFPFFTGLGISQSLKSTKIFFCDPLLHLSKDNKVFWYVGTKKLPTQKILVDILEVLKKQLNVKKMIFWGSSGGGFPALLLSNIFDNSIALVNAPTTTLQFHHNTNAVLNLSETLALCLQDDLDATLDLSAFSKRKNNAIILQNNKDKVFIQYHLKPYLEGKGINFNDQDILDSHVKLIFKDWGKGHLVAPMHILSNLLRFLEKKDTDLLNGLTAQKLDSIINCDVCISDKGRYLEVKILNIDENSTYAAYLCNGSRVVDKIMYQDSNIFLFEKKYATGNYYIRSFTKFKDDRFVVINNSISFIL